MKRGEVPRFYARDYDVRWKFVPRETYALARDLYWSRPLISEADSDEEPEDFTRPLRE
jgi:hypothetical protein